MPSGLSDESRKALLCKLNSLSQPLRKTSTILDPKAKKLVSIHIASLLLAVAMLFAVMLLDLPGQNVVFRRLFNGALLATTLAWLIVTPITHPLPLSRNPARNTEHLKRALLLDAIMLSVIVAAALYLLGTNARLVNLLRNVLRLPNVAAEWLSAVITWAVGGAVGNFTYDYLKHKFHLFAGKTVVASPSPSERTQSS